MKKHKSLVAHAQDKLFKDFQDQVLGLKLLTHLGSMFVKIS